MPHDQDQEESEQDDSLTPGSWSLPMHSLETNDYGALLLGSYELCVPGRMRLDVKSLFPSREQVLGAWNIFLANINPLSKMLHAPTFQTKLEWALDNPTASSRNFDALMFAICFSAINTATNEECEYLFSESKDVVMDQLQHNTSQALVAADILRTDDMEVCQAFTIFLV